ncbi:MAG: hypothetical protein AB7H70_08830 [Rhodospirillaceae bacterium]
MVFPQAQARRAIRCDDTASVVEAVEAGWMQHQASKPGVVLGLYEFLSHLLTHEGCVVDATDGLEILEHCRRRNLPIVDILHVIEARVHEAGYTGGRLGLADFTAAGRLVYVFYDAARFKSFEDLKRSVAHRVALSVTPVAGPVVPPTS